MKNSKTYGVVMFLLTFLIPTYITYFSSQTAKAVDLLQSRMYMDCPVNNSTYYNKNIVVSGWALNGTGVKEVKIYVDNVYFGSATIGLPRADVNAAFPGYPGGGNSGYSYNIDIGKVSEGKHNIKAEAIGTDNSKQATERTVAVIKTHSRLCMEYPVSNSTYNNKDIVVSGWALNISGIKEVRVYSDNVYMGNATIGLSRADVNNAYPGYPKGAYSGYTYTINVNKLIRGNHVIKVEAVGNDATKQTVERTLNITKPLQRTYIDAPANNSTYNNTNIKVNGWALHPSGVKQINVSIGGKVIGSTKATLYRPDVNKAFPGYPSGDYSGYSYTIDVKTIKPGTYNVTVESIGNDGEKQSITKSVTITKPIPRLMIDSPRNGAQVSGASMNIRGWALNASGVSNVKAYIDNAYAGQATLGLYRPDVNTAFPGYPSGNYSGYSISVNVSNLAIGAHTIKVVSTGNDGTYNQATFTIIKAAFNVFDSTGKFIQGFSDGNLLEAIKTASKYKDAVVKRDDKIIWDSTGYWTYNGEVPITKFSNSYDAVQSTLSVANGKVITKFGTELLNNTTGYKGILAVTQYALNLRQQPDWSSPSDAEIPSGTLLEVVRRTNSFYEVKWHKDESTVLTGYVSYYLDFVQDDKNDSMLGYISGKEESDFNPAAISDNPSDLGGVSCGVWQFSSNAGSLTQFMMWLQSRKPEFYTILNDARIKDGNSYKDNFKATWISLASSYYDEFFNIQQEFAKSIFYDSFIEIARANGYEPGRLLNYNATRNMIWSTAIQHGATGAYRIFSKIDSNLPMEDYIKKVYEARLAIIAASYPPDSPDQGVVAIYSGVKDRFDKECAEIIRTYQREISY